MALESWLLSIQNKTSAKMQITSWCIVMQRNATHETRTLVGQALGHPCEPGAITSGHCQSARGHPSIYYSSADGIIGLAVMPDSIADGVTSLWNVGRTV